MDFILWIKFHASSVHLNKVVIFLLATWAKHHSQQKGSAFIEGSNNLWSVLSLRANAEEWPDEFGCIPQC
jgi:hypothetical protein